MPEPPAWRPPFRAPGVTGRRPLIGLGLAFAIAGCATPPPASGPAQRVLVFSHSTGYRHDSIPAGVAAVTRLARQEGFQPNASEDPAVFTAEGLRPYRVIVLLSTTTRKDDPQSEWFVGERRDALQSFLRRGGGIVAIHAAADSHYGWPWYRRMIGGQFARHPPGAPTAQLRVHDGAHPAVQGMPAGFVRSDEWYYFDDYDPSTDLLLTFDPASIGERDVNPNPAAWAHTFEGGRVFYTAMGHTRESFAEPLFLRHLAGGLRWAANGGTAAARRR